MCGACEADLALLATETAEAAESALVVSIMLVFFCVMSGMMFRATSAGQYVMVWLDAYEGKTESLAQWNAVKDMSTLPSSSLALQAASSAETPSHYQASVLGSEQLSLSCAVNAHNHRAKGDA
jgi:hypothetical protein